MCLRKELFTGNIQQTGTRIAPVCGQYGATRTTSLGFQASPENEEGQAAVIS